MLDKGHNPHCALSSNKKQSRKGSTESKDERVVFSGLKCCDDKEKHSNEFRIDFRLIE